MRYWAGETPHWVVQTDASAGAELAAFRAAVEQRFGADQARTMLRTEGRPGAVQFPGPAREQAATDRHGLHQGLRAAERQEQVERQALRRGRRLRM